MAEYPRTEEGFKKAWDNLRWLVDFHQKPFTLYVPEGQDHYQVQPEGLVTNVAAGTHARTLKPEDL